jgi:hypothetical protein
MKQQLKLNIWCDSGVEYPATLIVHTPSGPVASCESHAAKIKALMAFMGAHTNATPAPEGAECANCRNESKRHTVPALAHEPEGGHR